ncbi:MAG: hypothetical protein J2P37_35735, partial [Ktedonobacteraceae bacterium]|nr:hypothetical protein [Ktedonobacteraceae bacterium]
MKQHANEKGDLLTRDGKGIKLFFPVMKEKQRKRCTSLALQIIPPVPSREDPDQQALSLEVAMQSLVLDERHPVALELAGTPERRYFLVRATTRVALDHVEEQLRTLYPQLGVEPLREADDPFCLAEHETV